MEAINNLVRLFSRTSNLRTRMFAIKWLPINNTRIACFTVSHQKCEIEAYVRIILAGPRNRIEHGSICPCWRERTKSRLNSELAVSHEAARVVFDRPHQGLLYSICYKHRTPHTFSSRYSRSHGLMTCM